MSTMKSRVRIMEIRVIRNYRIMCVRRLNIAVSLDVPYWPSQSSLAHLHSFLSPTNLWEHSLPGIPSDHTGLGSDQGLYQPTLGKCHLAIDGDQQRGTQLDNVQTLKHSILNRMSSSKLSCQGQGICVEEVTDGSKRTVDTGIRGWCT